MSEETSFEDYEDNTSVFDSSSLEADGEVSRHKKESGYLFRSESDIDTSTLESNSEDSEANSSIYSLGKKSIESELEVELEETLNQSRSFSDTKQTFSASAKSQQLAIEGLTAHSNTSTLGKECIEDLFEDEVDRNKSFDNADPNPTVSTKSPEIGTEDLKLESSASNLDKEMIYPLNKSFDNADPNPTVCTKSPDIGTGDLKMESSESNLDKKMIEEPIKQINLSASGEQDGTINKFESVSNAEQSATSGSQHSLSPTEAMKALRISETPSSVSKNTPRQSRVRAKTFNIFDSPYNTRLKARMIKEREIRSLSQGAPTEE